MRRAAPSKLGGNVLSLYSPALEQKTLTNEYDLAYFFKDTSISECSVDFGSVKNAHEMFRGCYTLSALSDGFNCPNVTDTYGMFIDCTSLTRIGNNVKVANGAGAANVENTSINKSQITSIGDNFEWFTNAVYEGDWDPSIGIRMVFPNATSVGSGWRVYNHYDGE